MTTQEHIDGVRNAYGFYMADDVGAAELRALVDLRVRPEDVPHAKEIAKGIPVYDGAALEPVFAEPAKRRALLTEWAWVFGEGPGALAISNAHPDVAAIDAATTLYDEINEREKTERARDADHFAADGNNARVWNSLQKLCLADPDLFLRYFGAPAITAASEAWLGPNFQMTAQVNLVRPGGAAQEAHRDYHLGFQTAEGAAQYPAHVHALSAIMTLQGAIAHCDMPEESGTTQLLPFSQRLSTGYIAFRQPEIRAIFAEHAVQLPLKKGDALFFNPALLHAAGANRTETVERMANLIQVSSAFGIALERIDRLKMTRVLYPAALKAQAAGTLSTAALEAAIACASEGYPFPTNLDTDPPIGGLAPESQQALFRRGLAEGMNETAFSAALDAQNARRQA